MLTAKGISKSFDGKVVLNTMDIVCPAAGTTVLLGQSGCGKSTILRLFMGLIRPDTGSIHIDGCLLTPESVRSMRQLIGYMVQDGGLFPHLTAKDNILLAARHFNRESEALSRLDPLLAMTKLDDISLDKYPSQLSGGQRQRVSLMRALALDPEYLLMDEPMGALDPMIRVELQQDLKTICKNLKKTVLLVTHDVSEAAFLGDHIIMLQNGCIAQQGSFASLVQDPRCSFVTKFISAQRPVVWPGKAGGEGP